MLPIPALPPPTSVRFPRVRILVTVEQRALEAAAREMDRDPARALHMNAAVRAADGERELLIAHRPGSAPRPVAVRLFRPPLGLRRVSHRYWTAFGPSRGRRARLEFGLLPGGGCVGAWVAADRVYPIHELRCVGPGLHRFRPGSGPLEPNDAQPLQGAFSRLAGALGGRAVHERLRRLRVAVAGTARLGSHLAEALARAGVSELTLIDPDLLEVHSLDALHADPADAGLPKALAVAKAVRRGSATRTRPLVARAQDPAAFASLAAADVIVSAPDDNRARLAAALAASAYLRPHLDLGAGVFGRGPTWRAGADVRLVLPGDGCLCCIGGLDLAPRATDWRGQRSGSLRSLNLMAVGQALMLLERLVAGADAGSTWLRLEVDPTGATTVGRPRLRERAACPLCDRVRGSGDAVGVLASEVSGSGDDLH